LYGRLNYERPHAGMRRRWALNLDRMERLLAGLGDPQDALRIVHVAGTKGKGSTATMIAAVLTSAGLRTGLYTSPHLEQLEQRMQIDGRCCTSDELAALVEAVRPVVENIDAKSAGDVLAQPTFFEITTAMALLYFHTQRVDAVALEVGLGGRLDSTNVCTPRVSVITSISFDHMEQLGKTLALIAGEKAGIIKPGVPVITGVTQSEPLEVIESIARERGAPLRRLGREFDYTYFLPDSASAPARIEFNSAPAPAPAPDALRSEDSASRLTAAHQLELGMWGRHQAANAAVALEALLELRRQGWELPDAAIRAGLRSARCPARVEVLSLRPAVIVDVAHNVASIAALIDTLDERFPRADGSHRTACDSPRMLIFAASSDKDLDGMLRLLLPSFDRILLTRYCNNPRSTAPEALLKAAEQIDAEAGSGTMLRARQALRRFSTHADPQEALRAALIEATPDHLLCVAGSLFLAAELHSSLRVATQTDEPAPTPAAPGVSMSLPEQHPPAIASGGNPQLVMAKAVP
jgi:dihydrofolate synthase/folylpolyglutamate synthase